MQVTHKRVSVWALFIIGLIYFMRSKNLVCIPQALILWARSTIAHM